MVAEALRVAEELVRTMRPSAGQPLPLSMQARPWNAHHQPGGAQSASLSTGRNPMGQHQGGIAAVPPPAPALQSPQGCPPRDCTLSLERPCHPSLDARRISGRSASGVGTTCRWSCTRPRGCKNHMTTCYTSAHLRCMSAV